jgi:hypothetical protein
VLLPHEARGGRAQLLGRSHDEMGSREIAGSEQKAHCKLASLFAQPYLTPPDYDTVEFPSKKEFLMAQKSAVQEYDRSQLDKATARREESSQQVDSGGMRMMNNAIWISERAADLQLRLRVEAQCRSAVNKAYEATLAQSRSMLHGLQ